MALSMNSAGTVDGIGHVANIATPRYGKHGAGAHIATERLMSPAAIAPSVRIWTDIQ